METGIIYIIILIIGIKLNKKIKKFKISIDKEKKTYIIYTNKRLKKLK